MNRFFIPPGWIENTRVTFSGETAHQISRVLRLRAGEQVVVLLGDGIERLVTLEETGGKEVTGQVTQTSPARGEPAHTVTLYQCLTQREKFEWILQKAVELGAAAVTPVISSRSLVRAWKEEDQRKAERWQKILQEAAEQSARGKVPRLNPTLRLAEAVRQAAGEHDLCLIPWEEETALSLSHALRRGSVRSIGVFIGPEGGFSREEVETAAAAGAVPVTLGPRILRTETAALAALAMIFYELEDMG